MITTREKLIVTLAVLFAPAFLFAAGQLEEEEAAQVSEERVIELIKSNQVDVIKVLGDTCGACHGAETQYPVAGAVLGYEQSGHALGFDKHSQNSWYANGNGCQKCHTSEGFVEYVTTGKVEGYVDYPSQPGCFSCHDPHTTGDFSLRTTAAVTLAEGSIFDKGDGNLCANCHQSRSSAVSLVKAMPAKSIRPYWGAHHGPEADMLNGTNGFENPAQSYGTGAHTYVVADSCVSCHLARPEGRYSLSPEVGGHSFYLKGEVHGATKINAAACKSCHDDVGQDGEFFDIKGEGDYDNDGTVEPVQAEVEGLLRILVNPDGTGLLQKTDTPLYAPDGSAPWPFSEAVVPIEEVAAIYNYRFVEEDRSLGIHNPVYAVQLLMDSIAALDPSFDLSERP